MEKQVFIIIGDELYQNEKLKEIFSDFKVNATNIEYFEPANHDWYNISLSLKTYSLFGTPKFFVVKNASIFKQEEDTKKLLDKSNELFFENNLEQAKEYLMQAIASLDLTEEEYLDILKDYRILDLHLENFYENLDFLWEILKKYPLPEKLPKKSSLDCNSFFDKIPEGHYLVITCEKADKRTKNFKFFEKTAHIFEKSEKKLTEAEKTALNNQEIEKFIKNTKKKMSKEAIYFLKEVAMQSQQLGATLKKLSLLTLNNESIEIEDIKEAFDDEYVPDALKISDFIKRNDISSIFKIVLSSKNVKSDYIKLEALLKNIIKTAIKIKEDCKDKIFRDFKDFEINFYRKNSELKKQHPYYLFQCYITFQNYSLDKLYTAYARLFEIEKALKTTQINPVDLFTDFFIFLTNPRN